MGADNYEKYRNFVRNKESGGNYQIENPFGYIGAYQFGAQALQAQGLIKPGVVTDYGSLGRTQAERAAAHKRLLEDDSNWTIPGGKQAYLNNRQLQDQAFDRLSEQNFSTLSKKGVITPDTPPDQIAGYGAASHLLGAGAVANGKLLKTDANGTSGSAYFKGASKAVNGAATGVPPDRPTASSTVPRSNTPDKRTVYNGSDRKLGETRIPNTVTIGASNPVEDIPVPFPNPLSAFSKFNAVFTLSCITADAHRDPKNTYKAGDLGEIVLRSAGAGSRSQETAMTTRDNPSGQYDFYIDNFDMNSIITFNQQTKGSNATDVTFEVVEPYSMGVFLQACELAARKNNWPNGYLNAVFLVTIEFVGFDDNGDPITIPNTTRNIPITIKDIAMTVKHGGARYTVKGHPSNELPLDNNYRLFEVDIAVSGKTVQEVLQTGEFSLQTVLNKRLQEFAEKEKSPTAFDEIVIVFPKVDNSNVLEGEGQDSNGSATSQGTTQVITVSRNDSASNLIQDTETLNEIGLSEMDFDNTTSGESKVNKQNDVQEDPKKPVARNKVVYDAKTRQFIYSQGTSIINAISSILINSKYCKNALETNKVDEIGMVNWFRIETQVDYQTPKEGNIGNNSQPKLLIFKIVPYKAHSEKSSAPSALVKGYDKLKSEAAKVYDYIYTGRNTEVLNFEIEFKQAFFNTVASDQNKQNKQTFNSGQYSATTQSNTAPKTPDNTPVAKEVLSGNDRAGKNLKVDPNDGGTTAEDHKTLIAKQFQRALNESETDLVTATMTIMGDPYFLADSGLGNFSNRGSGRFNVTDTNAMDYQSGEVDIIINFRTPLDYDQDTGIMSFGDTEIVDQFSGLYKVNFVTHRFQRGKFTQELKLQRRKKQSAEAISENEAAAPYAGGSEEIVDETGQVSNLRRNTETGELYDGTGLYNSGGRATANPNNTSETNKTTTVAANSASPTMTDAERKQMFTSDWMVP